LVIDETETFEIFESRLGTGIFSEPGVCLNPRYSWNVVRGAAVGLDLVDELGLPELGDVDVEWLQHVLDER
jgi:hypothetical protein